MSSSIKQPNIITCKAAVAWGAGEALVMQEVEVSPPHPQESESKWSPPLSAAVTSLHWILMLYFLGYLAMKHLGLFCNFILVATLPDEFPDAHSIINDLRVEYVVVVEGVVQSRPVESVNKKLVTGSIEVVAEHVQLLNAVKAKLPFLVTTADDVKDSVKEEIRLRYRCLDLRRQQMSSNFMLRHRVVKLIRRYLEDVQGFVEVRLRPPYFLDLLQKVHGIIWCPQEFRNLLCFTPESTTL